MSSEVSNGGRAGGSELYIPIKLQLDTEEAEKDLQQFARDTRANISSFAAARRILDGLEKSINETFDGDNVDKFAARLLKMQEAASGAAKQLLKMQGEFKEVFERQQIREQYKDPAKMAELEAKQYEAYIKREALKAEGAKLGSMLRRELPEQNTAEYKRLSQQIDNTRAKLEQLYIEKEKIEQSQGKDSEAWKQVSTQIETTRMALSRYEAQQKRALGGMTESGIQERYNEILRLTEELAQEYNRLNEIRKTAEGGGAQEGIDKSFLQRYERLAAVVKAADLEIQNLGKTEERVTNKVASGTSFKQYFYVIRTLVNDTERAINAIISKFRKLGSIAVEVAKKIASAFKDLGSKILGTLSSAISNITDKFKSLRGHSISLFGSGGLLTKGVKNALRFALRYVLGVRSLFFLFRRLRKYVKEMLDEMAKQVPEVNKQMSQAVQALTTMKAALGTMFQPLLTAIVPLLQKMSAWVSKVSEQVASFFALLTGQNYIVVATVQEQDYAKSLEETGKQAKKSKKYMEGYLSPIDEINKYKSSDKSDDGITYKLKPIKKAMEDFWKWLKDMWKKADFTELGKKLGEKLLNALKKIPWAKIKKIARKLGKSLATLLNGFLEVEGLGYEIGKTVAEALNSVFELLNAFVHNFHWKSLGKFIADTFNGWFENIDWPLIYDTVVTGLRGLADAIWAAILEFHWDNISDFVINALKTLADGITAFFKQPAYDERGFKLNDSWAKRLGKELGAQFKKIVKEGPWKEVGEAIGSIIKAVLDFAIGFIQEGPGWEEYKVMLHDLILGLLTGLELDDETISKIMGWVDKIEGYISDFVQWCKDTNWEEVWDTVKKTVNDAWDWVNKIWDNISPVVTDILDLIAQFAPTVGSGLLKFFEDLSQDIKDFGNSELWKKFVETCQDWINKTTPEDVAKTIRKVAGAIIKLKVALFMLEGIKFLNTTTTAIRTFLSLFGLGGGAAAAGGAATAASTMAEVAGSTEKLAVAYGALWKNMGAVGTAAVKNAGGTGVLLQSIERAQQAKSLKELEDLLNQGLITIEDFNKRAEEIQYGAKANSWWDVIKGFFIPGNDTDTIGSIGQWFREWYKSADAADTKYTGVMGQIKTETKDGQKVIRTETENTGKTWDEWVNTVQSGAETQKKSFTGIKDTTAAMAMSMQKDNKDINTSFNKTGEQVKVTTQTVESETSKAGASFTGTVKTASKTTETETGKIKKSSKDVTTAITKDTKSVAEAEETVVKSTKESNNEISRSWQNLAKNVKNYINQILGYFEKMANALIDVVGTFGDIFKDIHIEIPGVSDKFKFEMPKISKITIPKLARGAVIPPNKTFLAALGDQKSGTNIETPLDTMIDAFNQALSMNGGGNQKIILNLMLPDKRTVAQYTIDGGRVMQSSTGRNPFLLERG